MLAAVIVVVALARFARASIYGLATPVDVEYDTPNLFTIRAIQAGRNVYAPEFFLAPPFGLTIYTPLYHYIVSVLPQFTNPFLSGRFVSLVFMVASGLLLFWVKDRTNTTNAAIAFGVFLLLWPVSQLAAVLRGDNLG